MTATMRVSVGAGLLLLTTIAADVLRAGRRGDAPVAGGLVMSRPVNGSYVGPQDQDEQSDVRCTAYCDPRKAGISVIEIRVPLSSVPLEPTELVARAREQTVDVTVYSDGFDRQLFVRFPSLAPKARADVPPPPGGAAPSKPPPGLERLVLADVVTTRDRGGERLRLFSGAPIPDSVVVQVTGLLPGLNYYWRVAQPAGGAPRIVMCRAAICPSDSRR